MWKAAVVFLALFLALSAHMRYTVLRDRFDPNADLMAQLAEAEFLDDPAPASDDWPQWRGVGRDGVGFARGLRTDWGGGLPLAWKVPGGDGYSSFAVRNGLAWTLLAREGKEQVVCFDLKDGVEKWAHAHAPARTFDYGGPRSTPTLDGKHLYATTSDGVLLCLDALKGAVVWQKDLGAKLPRWGLACSPLVEGGLVLVARGGEGRCLAAFAKDDGKLKWTSQDDEAGYSSPLAATLGGVRQAVCLTGSKLMGVAMNDGRLLWQLDWPTQFQVNAATTLHIRAKSGGKSLDYVFVTSGYGQGCALVKVSPRGGGAFDARAAWASNALCCHFASPVRQGAYVYGMDETRGLTCLDLRTGEAKWRKPGFQKGSLLRVGGLLLAQTERGAIALVEATPDEYEEKGRFRPRGGDGRFWAMPTLAEGLLLVRDRRSVFAYKAK